MMNRRWIDVVLGVCFSLFAFTSLFVDVLTALDVDLAQSSYPLAGPVLAYAKMADPLLIANPPALQAMCAVSAFVLGPFCVLLAWALFTRRAWIRVPALVFAGATLYSMVIYFAIELMSDTPPPNVALFFTASALYVVAPAALIWRFWRA